ncbi:MAG: hypothetical protein ABIC91_04535 [Nanoarchaeota archaeon]|nr:hypothetical protein [Nanoarchaeota archaeon]MBU1850436.1 hypothetical protein [Nanoarchaeota archaeon]
MKKHMSKDQEFEMLKLVLDKFLWLGVILMAFGFYKLINMTADFWFGFAILVGGGVVMFLFMWILIREYHFIK